MYLLTRAKRYNIFWVFDFILSLFLRPIHRLASLELRPYLILPWARHSL